MAIRRVTRAGVGLVVGIIILAALVLGGLWLVRERGEQARRDEAINIAEQQLQSESDQDIALDTDNDSGSTESEDSSSQTQTGATNTTQQPATATELPQTGPGEQLWSLVAVALVTFSVVGYLGSKKQLQNY